MAPKLGTELKTLAFPALLNIEQGSWKMMAIDIKPACRFGFSTGNAQALTRMLNMAADLLILLLPFKFGIFFGNSPELLTMHNSFPARNINLWDSA